ncbi:deaminase [Erythrobacter sp. YT30]|uniref:deaminase n=1 Tax=Erythrobacter sp. YT30 TaxID=1735012 RepID=UPI00076D51F4|nr:deaminase [Erythrobacter sp. YT30]KWV91768.1 hypothetical protein AUC45_11225 [Erythrobacter sp. YT30]
MEEPIEEFLKRPLEDLIKPSHSKLSRGEKERHRIYSGALAEIIENYWCGTKYGVKGEYPLNPRRSQWDDNCPHLEDEYRGHNIAALAVDHDGYIIDFDFNHNQIFDSSVEHAEARLIKRVFSLTQLQDSWNVASADNPADKYSNALSRVTVYTSLESCTQCTGIMMLGRVKRVVYLQTDPGMYHVGDLFHTLTARKDNPDYIVAPEPVSATKIGMNLTNDLDTAFRGFVEERHTAQPFFIDEEGEELRTSSITSFLCTEAALAPFSRAAQAFRDMELEVPKYRPAKEGKTDGPISNKCALREAREFVEYAKKKGSRGTPHR